MGRVEGKAAVVTGAASGIGEVTAKLLASEGAAVAVADLDGDGAQRVAGEIEAQGGRAVALRVDVGDPDAVERMITDAVSAFGGLDVLHNNAAAVGADLMARDHVVAGLDLEVWQASIDVNVRGVALGIKHAIPHMLERGGGSIISTSSGSGLAGDVTRTVYGVTKAAVNALTWYTAAQYGKQGIRANAIAPGLVMTPAAERNLAPEMRDMMQRHHLTARVGVPEDIAAAVLYLASDESAFVTGQVLSVDGGLLSHNPMVADLRDMMGG